MKAHVSLTVGLKRLSCKNGSEKKVKSIYSYIEISCFLFVLFIQFQVCEMRNRKVCCRARKRLACTVDFVLNIHMNEKNTRLRFCKNTRYLVQFGGHNFPWGILMANCQVNRTAPGFRIRIQTFNLDPVLIPQQMTFYFQNYQLKGQFHKTLTTSIFRIACGFDFADIFAGAKNLAL